MAFGWAYINCADTGSVDILGDVSDVTFVTARNALSTTVSGSSNFQWLTSSATLVVSGSVIVEGALTASTFVTDINLTGSTYFGNDTDDVHIRTGSMYLLGAEISASTSISASEFYGVTLSASTSISASEFYGDASTLSNLPLAGIFTQTSATQAYTTSSIGVGSTSPEHTLSVTGTLGTSGDLTVSGSVYLGNSADDVTTINAQVTSSQGAYFADRVGIGTNSPQYILSVTGAVGVSGDTSLSGNVTLGDAAADIITVAGLLTASQGGYFASNVGVGTASPNYMLSVTGTLGVSGDTTLSGNVTLGDASTDIVTVTGQVTSSAGILINGGTGLSVSNDVDTALLGDVTLGNAGADTTTVNSQLTGSHGAYFASNVGVGTASPNYMLSVTGTVGVSGDTSLSGNVVLGDAAADVLTVTAAHVSLSNVTASTDNTVLVLDSNGNLAHDEIDSKVWDGKLLDYYGTPNANNIAIMYDSNTIKSTGDLYWSDGPPVQLSVGGVISASVGLTSSYVSASDTVIASSFSASNTETATPDLTADKLIFIDATDSAYKAYGFSTYATAIAGDGLDATNGILSTTGGGSGGGIFTAAEESSAYTTSSIKVGDSSSPTVNFNLQVSGSSLFGSLPSHDHIFTGSVYVITAAAGGGNSYVTKTLTSTQQFSFRGLVGGYGPVSTISTTSSTADYILGVSASSGGDQNMNIRLHAASDAGEGALMVIKDQVLSRTDTRIYISASGADTIDGETSYILTGTLASINLYSDGSGGWFIF